MKTVLSAISSGRIEPVYLVHGDRVLAEPAAARLAEALGKSLDCEPRTVRHPDALADVIGDLRTFSLFESGKLVVVVESGVLADRTSAAALFDDVRGELPWSGGAADLTGRAREAALRLLQILRLFDLHPVAGQAEKVIDRIPPAVFAGKSGRSAKAKGAVEELKTGMKPLLEAALAAGLRGLGEGAASLVADLLRDGLPERHALVLVESAVADSHPLLATLTKRGAVIAAGEITVDRGKFGGLAALTAELERETGAAIDRLALEALAERTLRAEDPRRGGDKGAINADSTARFAGEYRKLANLSGHARRIDLALVDANVEDRGEEDVWGILDAVGAGKAAEVLTRLARKISGAEDPVQERLAFFGALAAFYRRIVAVRGIALAEGMSLSERNYKQFESNLFPRLVGAVDGLGTNPLKGSRSAYPVFKAYQAAARIPAATVDRLPALLLETERRIKGDSGEPDAALAALVLAVAHAR